MSPSLSLIILLAASARSPQPPDLSLTIDHVVTRMLELDEVRRTELQSYTSVRLYVAENKRFNKHAEMTVRVKYASPGTKTWEVISEQGSKFVRGKVLKKVIEAEMEAAREENGNRSRIIPQNYEFALTGFDEVKGRPSYVISITPRTPNKFLVQGRIWVDSKDFAIVRLEGSPAKNPSFWTTKVQVTHEYEKHGHFWLPRSNFSQSKVRIVGACELKIDYFEYELNGAPLSPGQSNEP